MRDGLEAAQRDGDGIRGGAERRNGIRALAVRDDRLTLSPVALFLTTTVAPGTTPPSLSITVPDSDALAPLCANAEVLMSATISANSTDFQPCVLILSPHPPHNLPTHRGRTLDAGTPRHRELGCGQAQSMFGPRTGVNTARWHRAQKMPPAAYRDHEFSPWQRSQVGTAVVTVGNECPSRRPLEPRAPITR